MPAKRLTDDNGEYNYMGTKVTPKDKYELKNRKRPHPKKTKTRRTVKHIAYKNANTRSTWNTGKFMPPITPMDKYRRRKGLPKFMITESSKICAICLALVGSKNWSRHF